MEALKWLFLGLPLICYAISTKALHIVQSTEARETGIVPISIRFMVAVRQLYRVIKIILWNIFIFILIYFGVINYSLLFIVILSVVTLYFIILAFIIYTHKKNIILEEKVFVKGYGSSFKIDTDIKINEIDSLINEIKFLKKLFDLMLRLIGRPPD